MDVQLEQQGVSVGSEKRVEDVHSRHKCIGIQAVPDACHAQKSGCNCPHSGNE